MRQVWTQTGRTLRPITETGQRWQTQECYFRWFDSKLINFFLLCLLFTQSQAEKSSWPSVHYSPCWCRRSLWFWGCSLLLSIWMCVLCFMLAPQNQPLNTLIIKSVKQAISEQSDLACNQALFIIILIVKGLHDYRLQDRSKVPY